jgi:hypothetical protein
MISRRIEYKIKKAKYGPGLGEVMLGAVLSMVFGAALAVIYLVVTPVQVVKQLPKMSEAGVVYYVEGSRDADHGKQWLRKKQLFVAGSSVTVNEDELNAWITAGTAPSPALAPKKPAPRSKGAQPAPPPSPISLWQNDAPNFHIRNGVLQIGCKGVLNLDLVDFSLPLVTQVSGRFVKQGDGFAFAADRFYIGSFPLHKLRWIDSYLLGYLLEKAPKPEDIAAAWKKLINVTIEGDTLELSMP